MKIINIRINGRKCVGTERIYYQALSTIDEMKTRPNLWEREREMGREMRHCGPAVANEWRHEDATRLEQVR